MTRCRDCRAGWPWLVPGPMYQDGAGTWQQFRCTACDHWYVMLR